MLNTGCADAEILSELKSIKGLLEWLLIIGVLTLLVLPW